MPTANKHPIIRGAAQAPGDHSVMRRAEASGRGIADANQAIQEEGGVGRDRGGIWGRHQARTDAGGPTDDTMASPAGMDGPVDMSHVFGGPSGGDMDIPPETAAAIVGRQQEVGGAPLAPEPMVGAGIHADGMTRPYVPFSPPPARVTTSMASTPNITVEGSDTGDLDTLTAGAHLAHALQTPVGQAQVGVQTLGDVGRSTRLDLLTDRQMRSENRLYSV